MISRLIAAGQRADILSQSRKLRIRLVMHGEGIRIEGRYAHQPDSIPAEYKIEVLWAQIMDSEVALNTAIDEIHRALEHHWRKAGR